MMAGLLSLIMPIFLLVAVGFVAVRGKLMPSQLVEALGSFVLNVALPALILHALLGQDLRQTFNWNYILAYAAGSLAVFAGVLLLFGPILKRPLPHAAVAALGATGSNSGFVGFPVASLALGAPALTALPLTMMVENILIIPLALALCETGRPGKRMPGDFVRDTGLRLLRTPLILAILIGIAFSALGLQPPEPVSTAIGMMADAAVPCALFVVGGTLAGLHAASVAGDVPWIVVGKLLLHPMAVAVAFLLIGGVPPGLMAAGIILASAPMMTIYPLIGARYGYGGMCAAALLAATVLSLVTLIAILGLALPAASGFQI